MGTRRVVEGLEILERANAAAESQRQAAGLGPSIYEQMWMRLDELMMWLATQPPVKHDAGEVPFRDYCQLQGRAQGMAEAIAIIGKPLVADIDEVRSMAVERWEARLKSHTVTKPKAKRKPVRRTV